MSPDEPTDGDSTRRRSDPSAAEDLEESIEEEMESPPNSTRPRRPERKRPNVFLRLYRGETSFDFIGNRRWWFGVSALIILIGIISLRTRGLNLGIDFKGGQSWLVSSQNLTVAQATSAAKAAGVAPAHRGPADQPAERPASRSRCTADLNNLPADQRQATGQGPDRPGRGRPHVHHRDVNFNEVGATWGSNVTEKAIEALIVFFIAGDPVHLAALRVQDGGGGPRGRDPRHPGHGRDLLDWPGSR